MKHTIRTGTFETNSSSTHSLTLMMKSDYNRWWEEDLYLYQGGSWCWEDKENAPKNNSLYTKEECINYLKNNLNHPSKNVDWDDEYEVDLLIKEYEFLTYEDVMEDEYAEIIDKTITTPSSEEVIGLSLYSYE